MIELKGAPVVERIERAISEIDQPRLRLAIYIAGNDEASAIYARSKVRKGESLGFEVSMKKLSSEVSQKALEREISRDAQDPEIHGIIIERPLPAGLDMNRLISLIPPNKDVEGLHPYNYGLMAQGRPSLIPPTSLGAMFILLHYEIEVNGREAVVLGRSVNVGRPLSNLLSQKLEWANSTVTLAHSRTPDLKGVLRRGDVLISAVGTPKFIKGDMIKKGAALIDIGISTIPGEKGVYGDADWDSILGKAGAATPTPGGSGPVTVASLFLNLCRAYQLSSGEIAPIEDEMIRKIYNDVQ
ncbi:MAG: bifunctional 5,10-methylenetetrahydrofolate dehydrogenase/5,10-methenyltetrahydrofolate cyclohydrolase [Thermoplasmatota archaeon]